MKDAKSRDSCLSRTRPREKHLLLKIEISFILRASIYGNIKKTTEVNKIKAILFEKHM